MNDEYNIRRIKLVCKALEELAANVVFIGGATVSLYKNRPAAAARPTDDIDIIIELAGYGDYTMLEEKLRSKGFVNDLNSKIICRFLLQDIIVDVMPTDEKILGFANRWYKEGFKHKIAFELDKDIQIFLFEAPWFIATKMEAFNDRGRNDGRMSSDFEDIVYVLNNRTIIWDELKAAPESIKTFLQKNFKEIKEKDLLNEWIAGHLEFSQQSRVKNIIEGIEDFLTN